MPTDPSFRMTIQDVFSIKGMGTVLTGRVESGTLRVGDEVYFNGPSGVTKAAVAGLEMFRKQVPEAQMDDAVGVLFKGIDKAHFARGDVISGSDADYSWSS